MNQEQVLDHLRASEALLEGHFELSSGNHSDRYFQCARVLQYPKRAAALAQALADRANEFNGGPALDAVVGPAMGAVVWSYAVASAFGCPSLFTERFNGEMTLRRGFRLERGARVLMVEDVLSTGGSAREAMAALKSTGVQFVGVGAIVNRTGGNPYTDMGLPLIALCDVDVQMWEPDECPLCAAGEKAVKPGSRTAAAEA